MVGVFQVKHFLIALSVVLFIADTFLFFKTRHYKKQEIAVKQQVITDEHTELIKLRVRHYYLQKNYRVLVKEYSRCKNK
jgi:hypothetical protein